MEHSIQLISNTDSSSLDSTSFGQSIMASSPLPQQHNSSSISGTLSLHFSQNESISVDTCSSGWSGEDHAIKAKKPRKQIDRFDGLTEEDVMKKTLPDYLKEGLDIIIVGINPGLTSAHVGHHYAGPGNHFWACVTEVGLVDKNLTCYDDWKLVNYGIGFTNVCSRPTKGAADLKRKEIKEGMVRLIEKLRRYRPKIVVFNGKGIYESFVGHKNFYMGRQPQPLKGTDLMTFVMPSSSARCAQLPRAADKLPFYTALKLLREHMNGKIPGPLEDKDVVFTDYTEMRVSQPDPKSLIKAERRRKLIKKAMSEKSAQQQLSSTKTGKGGPRPLLAPPTSELHVPPGARSINGSNGSINGRSVKEEKILGNNGLVLLESDKMPPQYQHGGLPQIMQPPASSLGINSSAPHPGGFLPAGHHHHRFPFYFHPGQPLIGQPPQQPTYYSAPPPHSIMEGQSPYFTNLLLSDAGNEFEPTPPSGIPTPFSSATSYLHASADEASSCSPPTGDSISPYFSTQNNLDEVLTYTTL